MDGLPYPTREDDIVGQLFFFDVFFSHSVANLWGFDGQVVVVKVALNDGGKLTSEVSREQNAECHGPRCPFKVDWGPIWCLWDVCNRVNDVPYCIMIAALIGVQL